MKTTAIIPTPQRYLQHFYVALMNFETVLNEERQVKRTSRLPKRKTKAYE
ncbi:MAG: hypothetical protein ACOYXA_08915 [Bacteroidota bacterium]